MADLAEFFEMADPRIGGPSEWRGVALSFSSLPVTLAD